jgi:hypothetical protein
VSRAGAIALLLLASALSPVLPGASATALPDEAVPDSIVLPLAPDFQPAQPTATPTPGGETPGTPDADPDDSTEPGSEETPGEEPVTTDPLEVSITRLTPSTLPRRGVVSISGRITNRSEEPWTDLTVYAATSATPITTEEELAVAEEGPSGVEPADYQRLVDPDLYAQARDLDPGESTTYQVRIPRDQLGLPTDPGVYRVGVQVLGTEAGGRIEGADGRARVLMASVPPGQRTQVSLALQMRKRTVRTATGEVDSVPGWQRTLGREGRMRQVVRLLATAGDYPLSVLVDPAVVEAVGSLAEGNTGIDLAATTADGIDEDTGTIADEPPPRHAPLLTRCPGWGSCAQPWTVVTSGRSRTATSTWAQRSATAVTTWSTGASSEVSPCSPTTASRRPASALRTRGCSASPRPTPSPTGCRCWCPDAAS